MTDDMPLPQFVYYTAASLAAILTVLGLTGRWIWNSARRALMEEIEGRMVSQATFKDTIDRLLERSNDRWREHDEREREYREEHQKFGAEVMERFTEALTRLNTSHEAMASELRDIRTLVVQVIRGQQP